MTDDVVIAQSKIEGVGVLAQRRFTPGEIVLVIDDSRIVNADHPLRRGGALPARDSLRFLPLTDRVTGGVSGIAG
jgi:hypothetical protein